MEVLEGLVVSVLKSSGSVLLEFARQYHSLKSRNPFMYMM